MKAELYWVHGHRWRLSVSKRRHTRQLFGLGDMTACRSDLGGTRQGEDCDNVLPWIFGEQYSIIDTSQKVLLGRTNAANRRNLE